MNIIKIFLVPIVILASSTALAQSTLSAKSVKYAGQSLAKQACRAVVSDDPVRLRRVLKDYRSSVAFSYTMKLNGNAIAGSFTCNGLALAPFSEQIGAQFVGNFLRTGEVSIEPVVASSRK